MTTLTVDPLKVRPGQTVKLNNTELTILSVPVLVGYFTEGVQRWVCDALQVVNGRTRKIRLEMAH